MPRFQTLFLLPLLSLPALLPQALRAGDDVQSPAAAALPARPDMAAIEQAWAAGDFVFVRQGLKRHAEETGTPLAQYRYGRVLLEGRGGPADPAAAQGWLEQAVELGPDTDYGMLARGELFKPVVGELAPDFKGRTIDGYEFKLSDYRGKVVLLDFWGNW